MDIEEAESIITLIHFQKALSEVKQRLEFSTFLHFNLVKVYACNSLSSENNVPANTMCTSAPP